VRSSKVHFALDVKPPLRYTVSQRLGSLALHDTVKQTETLLYSTHTGNRHGFKWCALDAYALADWLNDRAADYPRHPNICRDAYDRS
jgi:hypothetical protein